MTEVAGPTLLFPRCASHPHWLARVACDRCGVFYCEHCSQSVGLRVLCEGCRSQPDLFSRDLVTEGHIAAIANFNFILAAFSTVALCYAYLQTNLLAASPARLPLAAAALVVLGGLPWWLGQNLRRYWPAGRAFQLFLAMGLLGIGGVLFFAGSGPARIQGFLLADYNFAILYVLISSSGSACFTPRYQEALADSPAQKPRTSSLYVLFVFWVLLTLTMVWDKIEFKWV